MAIIIIVIILIICLWLYFRNKNERNSDEELDIPIFDENILTELENEASRKLCKSIVELKLEQDGLQLYVNRNFRNEFKAISFDIFKIGLWKTFDKQTITHYLYDTNFIEENCQRFLNKLNIQISNKSIIVKPDREFQWGGTLSYDESSDINKELYSFVHYVFTFLKRK